MFVGRTDALNRLGGLWQKSTPSLVTVRGRALVYDGKLAPAVRTEHMLDFVIPAERFFE